MYVYPYVSVCWLLLDPLFESDFEFKRYISTIKLNFTPKSIEMLDSLNQAVLIQEFCKMKQQQVIDQIREQAQKIEKDKRELKINNDHKLDPWKMKDLEQKLIDLNKLNKKNHLIYDF